MLTFKQEHSEKSFIQRVYTNLHKPKGELLNRIDLEFFPTKDNETLVIDQKRYGYPIVVYLTPEIREWLKSIL